MNSNVEISIAPETLPEGLPEERATFGSLRIRAGQFLFSEGLDHFIQGSREVVPTQGYREGPLVAGYYPAEWLLWNWWRLRWEPKTRSAGWFSAHVMAAIGYGYVWPNLAIWSDGERTAFVSTASPSGAKPYRYLTEGAVVVPSSEFEAAVDGFASSVLGRLRQAELRETNLARVKRELVEERSDPRIAQYRRLEASLGFDPDAAEEALIKSFLSKEERFGRTAIEEVAANYNAEAASADIMDRANAIERDSDTAVVLKESDGVTLAPSTPAALRGEEPAWRVGRRIAAALRSEERLHEAIENRVLAEMAGGVASALEQTPLSTNDFSFVLRGKAGAGRLVLRSKWETGRRFDLARLIGDRLLYGCSEGLAPATRSSTYRQKAQRAFAAELLCPIDALKEFMNEDYSGDRQQEAASHFNLSPWAITSHLKNHRLIDHDVDPEVSDMLAA